jgi:hypothetical protein
LELGLRPHACITTLRAASGGGGITTVLSPPAATTATVTGTLLNAETGAAVRGATIGAGSQAVAGASSGAFPRNAVTPAARLLWRIKATRHAEHLQVNQVSANQTLRAPT